MIHDAVLCASVGHPALQARHYESCKRYHDINITTRAGNSLTTTQVWENMRSLVKEDARKGELKVRVCVCVGVD